MFVDAVHYAPHALVDVQALGCDFLACSAYKFYGPHVGVLYGRARSARARSTCRSSIRRPTRARAARDRHAESRGHRRRRGGGGLPGVAAPTATGSRGARALEARRSRRCTRAAQALVDAALDGLRAHCRRDGLRPGARHAAHADGLLHRARIDRPTTSRATLVARGLSSSRTATSTPTTVVERLGTRRDGFVRAGCACYTTGEEVERLVQAVGVIAG